MSLNSAMGIAVSGLDAESTELTNISNNIAGSSTVGYKDAQTDFETLVLGSGGSAGPDLSGVSASTQLDVTTAGQLTSTGVATDIAISGNGFMVVNTAANQANGQYLLTQAGSFRPDANGNLVNAAGYYLQGQPLTAANDYTASPASSVNGLSTVNIANISAAAAPTTAITFGANLPITNTDYAATPTVSSSSVTYYDDLGTPQTLKFSFTPTNAAASGDADTNEWSLNITDSASATGVAANSTVGAMSLAFDPTTGNLASSVTAASATTGSYNATTGVLTVTTADGQQIGINIGAPGTSTGLTQLDGAYQTTSLNSNGSSFGTLQSVSIGTGGVVTAAFSNGSTRPIYQLDLANVPNPDGLGAVTGDAYSITPEAGVAQLYTPGTGSVGTTVGGSLEGSNVDLSTELTNLIATQRAYSSSAQVIQAANGMLQVLTTLNQ